MGGNFGHFLPLFLPHLYITLDGTRQDRPNRVAEGGGWATPPLCFEWGFMRTFPRNQDATVK